MQSGCLWVLNLMAGGTMLGFVIVHGDFKHVVAADANAMDLHRWFFARLHFARMLGMRHWVCLSHKRILTRTAVHAVAASHPSVPNRATRVAELCGMALLDQLGDAGDDFMDADRAI